MTGYNLSVVTFEPMGYTASTIYAIFYFCLSSSFVLFVKLLFPKGDRKGRLVTSSPWVKERLNVVETISTGAKKISPACAKILVNV